ncbi:hypothetical protein CALVIDRAFT_93340 [Calocera viscosa TUFC12733]|uniref:REJ domain-containing protein n=1 Tax=Calocera viscosa (strain TUFC12733) TaxID=1330018 RepID=A0A167MVN3_CALVF|nr:hypothetical protein CALVIDRAFT_93340 [Calocera viscosa TUFC12733]
MSSNSTSTGEPSPSIPSVLVIAMWTQGSVAVGGGARPGSFVVSPSPLGPLAAALLAGQGRVFVAPVTRPCPSSFSFHFLFVPPLSSPSIARSPTLSRTRPLPSHHIFHSLYPSSLFRFLRRAHDSSRARSFARIIRSTSSSLPTPAASNAAMSSTPSSPGSPSGSPSQTPTSTPSPTSSPDTGSASLASVASVSSLSAESVLSTESLASLSSTASATQDLTSSLSAESTASLASLQSLSAQSVLSTASQASVLSNSLASLPASQSSSILSSLSQQSQSSVQSTSMAAATSAGLTVLASTEIVTVYTDSNGQLHTLFSSYPYATQTAGTSGTSHSNTGAIVGGVVGGVAGLALIALLLFFLMRRSRARDEPLDPDTMFDPDRTVVHKPVKAPGLALDSAAAGGGLAGEGGTVIDQSLAAQPWRYDGPGGQPAMSQYGGSVTTPGMAGTGAAGGYQQYYNQQPSAPQGMYGPAIATGAGGALTAGALAASQGQGHSRSAGSDDSASRYPETHPGDVQSESTGEGSAQAPSAAYGLAGSQSPPNAGGSRFAVANPDVAAAAAAGGVGGARYSKAREAAADRQAALAARQQQQAAYYAPAPSSAPSTSPPPTSASPPPTSRTSNYLSDDGSVLSGDTQVVQHRDGGRFVEAVHEQEGEEEVPPSYDMIPESERGHAPAPGAGAGRQ